MSQNSHLQYSTLKLFEHRKMGPSIMGIDQAMREDIVRRILSVTSPEKIILFGSAVTGEMTEDSDIDLLIVEKDITDRRHKYVRIRRALRDIPFPFDIVLTTSDYFEQTKNTVGGIAYPVNKEGRLLYEAA